ncbi:MAG: DinB family protein [Acidimicrobiales bacterium]
MPPAGASAALHRLKATALDLVSLVSGADPVPLRRSPAPGEWSAAVVVAHLADAELVYGVRARMILTVDRPFLPAFPQEAWAARFAGLDADVRDALHRWRALRDANLRLFASAADEEWEREGVHQERGPITLAALAGAMASHDRAHLDQIRAALAGAG